MAEPGLRWPSLVGTAASVAGLGVSAYLTFEHFTGSTTLACSAHGVVDCLAVTTSGYASIAGVPVAVLGIVFFALMVALQLPATWRMAWPGLRWARVAWALVGLGTAGYLVFTELAKIDAICLWCTSVHALTVVLCISTTLGTRRRPLSAQVRRAGPEGSPLARS